MSEPAGPAEAHSITLVPLREADLARIREVRMGESGTGEFQWFGHGDQRSLERQFAESGCLCADGGLLTVLVDGDWAGTVEWFPGFWGPRATSRCWTIAIGVVAEQRGRGIGSRAQALLAEYLFAHSTVERLQAWTDVNNIAEQRALAKACFSEEGILRNAQWRGGRWHDQKLYSRLRTDSVVGQ
ncbi:GNAT family N-acetyltransferase [Leucobacter sp. NPDC058333]|uniref:GNAT family N-acetyltransferase n=1 Tax=Leucobacter sp. NPDC058333 TaxID=3346450 RepID=UPI0036681106